MGGLCWAHLVLLPPRHIKNQISRELLRYMYSMQLASSLVECLKPVVTLPNPDIPDSVILELHRQRIEDSLSMEDAATNIRGSQVPDGHSPYQFRRDTHPT